MNSRLIRFISLFLRETNNLIIMKKIFYLLFLCAAGTYAQTDKDVVKFTAKIENRNSDSIVFRGPAKFRKAIKIDKKGTFHDSFAVPKSSFYQISDGVETTLLYLKNGYDLALTMDAKQFDESIVYKGKGEKENNFLAQKALIDEKFEDEMGSMDEKTFNETSALRNQKFLDQLKDPSLDSDFKSLVTNMIIGENTQRIEQYNEALKTKKLSGNASPSFSYENYKGGTTKLEDFKGKYVYIDVWATWCGPCRAEIPFLQKVEEKYSGKNIAFVSISIDVKKDNEKWKKMVGEKNLGGTQLFADNDWNSEFIKSFGINSIPRFILIDPKGNVIDANAKRPSDPSLQVQLDQLVK